MAKHTNLPQISPNREMQKWKQEISKTKSTSGLPGVMNLQPGVFEMVGPIAQNQKYTILVIVHNQFSVQQGFVPKSQMLLLFLEAPIKMAFMSDKIKIYCIQRINSKYIASKVYMTKNRNGRLNLDVHTLYGFNLNMCGDNLSWKQDF